jgi:hypothetical protein
VIADVFFFFLRKKQNPELFKILQKAAIAYWLNFKTKLKKKRKSSISRK